MRVLSGTSGLLGNRTFLMGGLISLMSSAVVVAAIRSEGSTATNVRLDDGAVWVTDGDDGKLGRLNVRIREVDFVRRAAGDADVLQESVLTGPDSVERTVVFSGETGGAQRLEVVSGLASGETPVPLAQYRIGGGVAAVLEPETGALWVGSSSGTLAPDYPDEPDGLVARGSHLVVTRAPIADDDSGPRRYGTVIVVDDRGWYEVALGDDLRLLPPGTEATTTTSAVAEEVGPQPVVPTEVRDLGVDADSIAAVTAVGPEPVVLLMDGTVVLSDGRRITVPGVEHRLQQVGDPSDEVLVASDEGLYAVGLGSGETRQLVAASATPSAPVRVGACVYGAWSGDEPRRLRACGDESSGLVEIPGAEPGAQLVWRVNQSNVALNDIGNGDVWSDGDGSLAYVGDWDDLDAEDDEDPDQTTAESNVVTEKECLEGGDAVPIASDDILGVRPRPSIIDVLYNDDDENCEPLAIASVTPAGGDWGELTIIGGRQHLLYHPSTAILESVRQGPQPLSFEYTVTDIAGNESAPATVTITVCDVTECNSPPELRPKGKSGTTREMRTVVEEGRAVSHNVLPDWWDPDGDDISLSSATFVGGGAVSFAPDGLVRFDANGVGAGVEEVGIVVTDGQLTGSGDLQVTVKPAGTPIPPITSDDFVTMVVGGTVEISPLANDTDPNGTPLTIGLPGDDVDGFELVVRGTTMEITAREAGVFGIEYLAVDADREGTAGTIRLEVVAPGDTNTGPIAVPDQVKIRPNRIVNVDVLANDVDADGDMLAVVGVDVATKETTLGQVRATLFERRMVQIEVIPGPNGEEPVGPFAITYEVTDGRDDERASSDPADGPSTASPRSIGLISVTVLPEGQDQPPVLNGDDAVVRVGDVVSVPVLLNDLDPDGDAITLTSIDDEAATSLETTGQATVWTEGREVRVQGSVPGRFDIAYTAEAAGRRASAILSVEVTPLPDPPAEPNEPPDPPDLELRAVRGGTVRLQVPTSGVDPDGDSVELVSVSPPGGRGNQVREDPDEPGTVLFRADVDAAPTDEFEYSVRDRFGARSTGTVRVLIVDDAGWPPQAFDDVLVGRPGRALWIPVLANDSSPQDRALEIAELPFFDNLGVPTATPEHPDLVRVLDQESPTTRGRIEVEVPDDGTMLVEHYRMSDGVSESSAYLRVTPDPDAPNVGPVAGEDRVEARDVRGLTEVAVDVLVNDFDPDDAGAVLALSLPTTQTSVRVEGDQLLVPLTQRSQVVLYRVSDADGATAVGTVRIPGLENQPPELSSAGLDPARRTVDAATGGPIEIRLADIVEDPDGDPVVLTDIEVRTAGPGTVVRLDDGTGFVFTPPEELSRTTTVSIGFQVTDRPELDDDDRQTPGCNCLADLTVGVVVASSSPPRIVRPGAVDVPVLDEPVTLDLSPLTEDDQGDDLTYALDDSTFGGLTISLAGSEVTIESNLDGADLLDVGQKIRVGYTVEDEVFDPVEGFFVVTIIDTNRPPPQAALLGTVEAEKSEPTPLPNLIDRAFNPSADDGRPLILDEFDVFPAAELDCTEQGACTFNSDKVGTFEVTYLLRDAVNRPATGSIEVVVKGAPLRPEAPNGSKGDEQITLTWEEPDIQGADIDGYRIGVYQGDQQVDLVEFPGTEGTVTGLTNGEAYRFTVAAHNEIGWSPESTKSSAYIPDRVPGPPKDAKIVHYESETLYLEWGRPEDDGQYTDIEEYIVVLNPGGEHSVKPAETSLKITGLTNGQDYTFTVIAVNRSGRGEPSSVSSSERPSTRPDPPQNVEASNSGDGGTPRITVSWDAPVDDGGRDVESYRVCAVGGVEGDCRKTEDNVAVFDAGKNQTYSFTVVAINTDKNTPESEPSTPSDPVTAVGNPETPVIIGVSGADKQLTVDASSSNGSGCNTYSLEYSLDGVSFQDSNVFDGLVNGTSYQVFVRAFLPPGCGTPAGGGRYESGVVGPVSATPYGELVTPSISASLSGSTITWTWWTNRSDDGRPDWQASLSGDCGSSSLSTDPGASGTISVDFGRTGQTYTCTITVSAGGQSVSDSESVQAPQPPPRVIETTRGGKAPDSECNGNCNYVSIRGANFAPNAALQVLCGGDPRWFALTTTGGDGSFGWVQSVCFHDAVTPQDITVRDGSGSAYQLSDW